MEDLLADGGVAILDGGLATELEQRGADLTGHLWSARLLNENPGLIKETHVAYFLAGADVGISSSYQATIEGFQKIGLQPSEGELLLKKSVDILKEARDLVWAEIGASEACKGRKRPIVAASIGSYGAYLADGSEYSGNYGLSVDDLKTFHRARMLTLLSASPDVLACETIPCAIEVQALLELLKEPAVAAMGIKAWISVSLKDSEHLNSGDTLHCMMDIIDSIGGERLVAVGLNCTAPRHVEGALLTMASRTRLPLVVYANKGEEWDGTNKVWKAGTATTDEQYCSLAVSWRAAGARIIGGCCRTSPETIKRLRSLMVAS